MADPIVFKFVLDDSAVPAPAKRTEESLQRVGKAAEAGGQGLLKFGADGKASAAQLQALSYQATDIVTSLVSGQSPFIVLLQQGGQLRDQFGGLGNVFRAVGSVLTPVAVGVGALTVGIGALALAAYQGYTEADRLTKQLALTGYAAGVTRGQVDEMARSLSDAANAPIGNARDALAGLAGTGAFVGTTLQSAGRAVLAVQRLSGQSTDEIVKQFAGMRSGVAAWAVEANKSYNVFSAAQIQVIRGLEAQGRSQEAARVALDAMAETMETRAVPALGYLDRAINAVKKSGSGFWDWLKGLGAPDTLEVQLASVEAQLRSFEANMPGAQVDTERRARINAEYSRLQQERDRLSAAIGSNQRDAERAASLSQQNQREILEASASYQSSLLAVDQAGEALRLAQLQRGAQARRIAADEGYRANLLSAQEYTAAIIETERAKVAAEEQAARAAIGAAQRRVVEKPQDELGRRQAVLQAEAQLVSVLARRDALEARIRAGEFRQAEQENARDAFRRTEIAQRNLAEAEYARWLADQRDETIKLTRATQEYGFALAEAEAARRLGNDRDLAGARLGASSRERAGRLAEIADQYNAERARLAEDLRTDRITHQAYQQRMQLLRQYHEEALQAEQQYQNARAGLEADASVGFSRALDDYLALSRDVASQSERIWGDMFSGLEDGLVQFVTTGKLKFGDLARSIIADLIRIQLRAQLAGIFGQAGGFLGSLFGSGGGGSLGGVNGSAGTPIIPPTFAAKGLATDGWQAFARGGVVDQPTFFRFAAGGALRNGVMGEAGPEAILPLRRGSDGSLGVNALAGRGGSTHLHLTVVNNTGNQVQSRTRQTGPDSFELLLDAVDADMAGRISGGQGATSQALQQRFGLRAAMG